MITGQHTVTTNEDTALTISLSYLLVTDPDNTYPTGFSLTVQAGTNYTVLGATITPAANFSGVLTVPVKVNDGLADSNVYNLTVTVTPVNDAPVITGQLPILNPKGHSFDNQPGSVTGNRCGQHLPDWLQPDGAAWANYTVAGATITPAAGFIGELTVPVKVNDGSSDSNVYNLTVRVNLMVYLPIIMGQQSIASMGILHKLLRKMTLSNSTSYIQPITLGTTVNSDRTGNYTFLNTAYDISGS